ncbi:MAG: GNAT family N-acetyltransferase [Gammaproteobacteria bacterium]|nr:GNAT family N-acetyltransferase [Gammaproteobacteria bacterium]
MKIINLKSHPEHLELLARWHHAEWSYLNPEENIAQRITRMRSYLNDDFIPSTFIANDRELLGSAAIVKNDMETKPQLSPWLASVYVAPPNRNRGIGTKLVLHSMEMARSNNINKLYLLTPDKKLFYQKLGWHIISEEMYHGYTVTVMEISLNNI